MTNDLHARRAAIQTGRESLAQTLLDAREASLSEACRHTFIESPGDLLAQAAAKPAAAQADAPLAGLPISIKDLFDVAGQKTLAGSTVLADRPAAMQDCPAIARLRAAGGLIAGRTNMVEFAFSGVGINPHYGTPVNPADKAVARIPGGSSSGAAVSVAAGAAYAALGSDTGGSLRIPAALCGIVGFKSTARLVPTAGAIPLSPSLDTVGALTRSVRDAITLHEVLSAQRVTLSGKLLTQMRLAVAQHLMLDSLEPAVAQAFERSLKALRKAGAQIEEIKLGEIGELASINATGGLSAAESHAWHRSLLSQHQSEYDPRVALRILKGAAMCAADYIDLLAARKDWVARMTLAIQGYDALLSPTAPLVAPVIEPLLKDDNAFFAVNGLLLRNTAVVNMLDGCGISIPCHVQGELPIGLMLWQGEMQDDAVLNTALAVEAELAKLRF
jgi:Asp-tRNA(Asn)/Glu-tRNA(Gln) amidotransferase A subunit family amidase